MTHPDGRRRVVVLRVGDGDRGLAERLAGAGVDVATVVVGDVADRPDEEVASEVGELARFAWVAVTSANAARRLRLWASAWPRDVRVAAVGRATAVAVTAAGCRCDAVPDGGTASDLADVLDAGPVLFLAASSARDDLRRSLGARGIEVATVVAYDVVPHPLGPVDVEVLAASEAIVARSPLAVDALAALDGEARASAARARLVVIGPTTASRARALGWPVAAEAATRDASSLADAVLGALATAAPPVGDCGTR